MDAPSKMPEGRRFTGTEMSDFLLRACHDLKSPLRAIRTHAELLLKDPKLEGLHDDPRLAFVIEGSRKLDSLVNEVSSYSIALRIDPGAFAVTPLRPLVRGALAKLDKERGATRVEVRYDDLPAVLGEPDRLMELFEKLLRHRMGSSSLIRINTSAHPDGWLFTLSDDGSGLMEPAELENLFRPFVHGLGLATCREIVERHGGKIWAESRAEEFQFLFTLPNVG